MRVLIFSADIGEGHDLPARALRDGILARRPDAEVLIRDTLQVAGPVARFFIRNGAEVVLRRLPWLFDLQYSLIARFPPTRALTRRLSTLVAGRGLQRAVTAFGPDVIVATYPGANEVLSTARRAGRLRVPVVSAITDLAALQYWAHPGTDLHLVVHAESAAEIRSIAGPQARVTHARGLTAPEFETPIQAGVARASLGLPPAAPVVVVSGGGWGVGDIRGATSAALAAAPDVHVVALCGRNADARSALERAFAGQGRVSVIGFTDQMSELLAAADVLIHSTAGLTVMEALVRGTRVISYGWGVAHI
ncbi:MAG: glycosyltransferase, partial [Solirubrobacterales bacterium]|nr:glycosyltransferase [Solirubrobacterales bacterium]